MTRRHLAQLAVGQAVLPAQTHYTGALDGCEGKVDPAAFDPVGYTMRLYDAAPLRLTFRAQDRKQAEAWRRQLGAKITELLGGFPAERAALQPQTLEVREFPGYRREKFVFQSRPGLYVLGYLVTPAKARAPYPAVVCMRPDMAAGWTTSWGSTPRAVTAPPERATSTISHCRFPNTAWPR